MSISSGSSLILTSKRSCTSLRILASFSSDTNVIAKPLVPNRPALATWKETRDRTGRPHRRKTHKRRDEMQDKETEGVGKDTGISSRCGAYPMQVGVWILRHVVVKGDVHPLDVHASAKQVGSHENPSLKIFKLLIPRKPLWERKAKKKCWDSLLSRVPFARKDTKHLAHLWLTSPPGASRGGWQWLGSSAPPGAEPGQCNAAQTSQISPPVCVRGVYEIGGMCVHVGVRKITCRSSQ